MTNRQPCPYCGYMGLVGARRCAGCRADLPAVAARPPTRSQPATSASRPPRRAWLWGAACAATLSGALLAFWLIPRRVPPAAPRITPASAPAPASQPVAGPPSSVTVTERSTVRVGGHPWSIAFGGSPERIYVGTGDGATVKEIDPARGGVLDTFHPGRPAEVVSVVHDRWLYSYHWWQSDGLSVWDLGTPGRPRRFVYIGRNMGAVLPLPDRESALVTACHSQVLKRVHLPDMRVTGSASFKHPIGFMVPVTRGGKFHAAVMGGVFRRSLTFGYTTPIGAWIDLFDPDETPFAANRRAIAAGRQPRHPGVTSDGRRLLFPDRMSNQATLVDLDSDEAPPSVGIGIRPEHIAILPGDDHAVSLDTGSASLTVMGLRPLANLGSIKVAYAPTDVAVSKARRYAAITLGGEGYNGQGVVVVGGTPPRVLAQGATGRGPISVAVSRDGRLIATANSRGGTVTILEVR